MPLKETAVEFAQYGQKAGGIAHETDCDQRPWTPLLCGLFHSPELVIFALVHARAGESPKNMIDRNARCRTRPTVRGPEFFRCPAKRRIARCDPTDHDVAVRSLNHVHKFSVAALSMVALAFKVCGQTNVPLEILATDATNYLNQPVIVRDVVVQVAQRTTVALLNLNHRYPDSPLTCVIRSADTNRFPDPQSYLGQRVEVSGHITEYQGRPQIILTNPNQINILNALPSDLPSPLVTAEPATKPVALDQPAAIALVTPQSVVTAEAKSDRAIWWIIGLFGAVIALFGTLILLLWWRGVGNYGARAPQPALARLTGPADEPPDPAAVEEWKQRAIAAEAMAGRQGQILREQLMPELAEFAKQSLVQGLYAQRNALIETQQVAQQALLEMESRLATLQLTLPERIRAYEKRIGELEKEVESQGEEMRELTRATLVLVRKKLEDERERERTTSRFN